MFSASKFSLARSFANGWPLGRGLQPSLHHSRPRVRVRHEAFVVLAKDAIAIAGNEAVDGVAQRLRHREQGIHPCPAWKTAQHGQRGIGLEVRYTAMNH